MEIEISKNGMVKKQIVIDSDLPIFDFSAASAGEETGIKIDYCTKAQLSILGIHLDKEEQKNFIIGFFRDVNYRGYLPLYSLMDAIQRRV